MLIITWRKCVRYLLSLPYRTSSYLIPHIMNTCNILDIIIERQTNFYVNMYNHKSEFIQGFLKNSLLCYSSYSVSNVNIFVNRYGIPYSDVFELNKSNIKRIVKQNQQAMDWRCKIIIEVMMSLDGQLHTGLSQEELKNILNDICTYV